MIATALEALSDQMIGRVVRPGDADYDEARTGFNLALDQRPALVAFPENEHDVAVVIDYARAQGLRVAPQATGHNPGPLGDMSDLVLLSVAEMRDIRIDTDARIVRVGAGTRWGEVTQQLSDLGLAALHGSSPLVGIAGYSLGGGMGWLARKYGLQTNSVTAIELVTADGRFVRADAGNEPDLFWALRGGNGNFGVVTAIEFKVYPVPELYAGIMFFPFERSHEVLHAWRELLPTLPDELMTWAAMMHFPDDPDVPEPVRGGSFVVVQVAYLGDQADGERLMAPIGDLGPVTDTRAMVPPIELAEMAMDPPEPMPLLLGHEMLDDLSAEALDDLLAATGPGSDGTPAVVQLRHMGGALSRKAPDAGARATLPGEVSLLVIHVTPDDATAATAAASIAAAKRAVERHRTSAYPNFVEHPADASAFFDADTWGRLRAIKRAFDPDEVFRGNHYIPPAE